MPPKSIPARRKVAEEEDENWDNESEEEDDIEYDFEAANESDDSVMSDLK